MEQSITKKRSLVLNSVLNLIRTILGVLYPLITFPYVSRVLGPVGTGKVAYANSIITYFSLLAGLGIAGYAHREGAKIREDKFALSKLCKETLIINLISSFISYILLIICMFSIPSLNDYKALLIVISTTIIFNTLGLDWVFGVMEDMLYVTIRGIIFMVVGLVLLFVFVKKPEDVIQYALLSVVVSVGANVFNIFTLRKYIDLSIKTKLEFKKHIKPIFLIFANTITISIYNVLDTTLVGAFCGDEEVGLYNAALKINRLVFAIIISFVDVVIPRMSYTIEHDKEQYNKILKSIFNLDLILSIPCMVGLIYLAEPITLFLCGDKFIDSISVMKLMTGIIVIIPLATTIASCVFSANRKDTYNLFPSIGSAIINLILNLILIPKYGAFGAGIGTICAELLGLIIRFIFVNKMDKQFWKIFIPTYQYLIAAGIMLALLILFNHFIPVSNVGILFAEVFMGAFIYGIILILFRNVYILGAIKYCKNKIIKK